MKKLPCTTLRSKVEIRGVYGQPVFDFYQQFCRILDHETQDRTLSCFFAEPQLNAFKGEIQWYSNAEGSINAYSQLDPVAKSEALKKALKIRDSIYVIGQKFAAGGTGAEGTRAEIFKAILSTTDFERCLFLVGEQPVLCEWGCKPIVEGLPIVDLWSIGAVSDNSHKVEVVRQEIDETQKVDEPQKNDEPKKFDESQIVNDHQKVSEVVNVNQHERINRKTWQAESIYTPNNFNNSNHQRISSGFVFWERVKKIIISLLLLLLLLLLLRGCSFENISYFYPLSSRKNTLEVENSLRVEISELRKKIHAVSQSCSPVFKDG